MAHQDLLSALQELEKSYEQKRYGADNWFVLVNMVFKEQFHF